MNDDPLIDVGEEDDYEEDDLDELLEAVEEDDEARRRRRRVPIASGTRSFQPRSSQRYATQTQLYRVARGLERKIQVNGRAIRQVNTRVNLVERDLKRQAVVLRKEVDARKKADAKMRNDLQMATLLPIITKTTTDAIGSAGALVGNVKLEEGNKLVIEKKDALGALLPILLLGGLGEGNSEGGGGANMLLLALVVSGGL